MTILITVLLTSVFWGLTMRYQQILSKAQLLKQKETLDSSEKKVQELNSRVQELLESKILNVSGMSSYERALARTLRSNEVSNPPVYISVVTD